MNELVKLEMNENVARVTLNDPDRHNALSARTLADLKLAVDEVRDRKDVHCVVLAGAGKSFCSGHALETLDDPTANDPSVHQADQAAIDAVESLPMPVIVAIHGYCLTGGLELALAGDLLVAADDAVMGDTHTRLGLIPIWGMSVRLPERVGRSRAKELSFTGRRISGREAGEIGLVDRVVPADQLETAVSELAAEIAVNSPGSNRIYKSLYAGSGSGRREALDRERRMEFGFPDDMQDRLKAVLSRSKG